MRELAHRGVHDREPGAPPPPRLDVVGRLPLVAPAVVPVPVVRRRRARPGREHLVVEVPPAQLAYERVLTRPVLLPHAVDELHGRERAEVQMRGEPRGQVARQIVVAVRVARDPRTQPRREPGPRHGLAAGRHTRRHLPYVGARRHPLGGEAGRDADGARGGDDIPHTLLRPAPEVGREHGEVVASRRSHLARRDGRHHTVVDGEGAAALREGGPQPPLPGLREASGPCRDVHRPGARLRDHGPDLLHHVPGPHDQVPAALAQGLVQSRQAVGQEGEAVGRGEPRGVDAVVPHEQRNNLVRLVERGAQRGMVVQPQVGREQHDRDGHGATPGTAVLRAVLRVGRGSRR